MLNGKKEGYWDIYYDLETELRGRRVTPDYYWHGVKLPFDCHGEYSFLNDTIKCYSTSMHILKQDTLSFTITENDCYFYAGNTFLDSFKFSDINEFIERLSNRVGLGRYREMIYEAKQKNK